MKFDEDKEDGDDELTVEEDEDEDELEVEDEEDEEDEASEGFGHELEVEEEEEEDEVLISHLSIAKSQIRPKVSIRLPKQVNFNTNDPETSGLLFMHSIFGCFFFLFLLHVSQAGIPRVTQNLPCLVVFVCMRLIACLTVNDYHWQRTSTLNVNCIRPVLNIPKTRCDWSSTLHFLILDMCAV